MYECPENTSLLSLAAILELAWIHYGAAPQISIWVHHLYFKELEFAFKVCKYVKSNAIVITKDNATIGIGAGQQNRLDSCKIATQKAKKFQPKKLYNSIAASDAFFPFADGIKTLINSGVKLIVQPGGSIRDKEVIDAANSAGIKMVFTGIRHFNH